MKSTEILERIQNRHLLTSSAVASLARTSALLEKVSELSVKEAAYGLKCSELYGTLDRSTCSLKTAQCSLFGDSSKSYATFPKSGMMRNGNVYLAPTLAYNRIGSDYIVLPTPVKSTANGALRNRYFGSPTYCGIDTRFMYCESNDRRNPMRKPNTGMLERLFNNYKSWNDGLSEKDCLMIGDASGLEGQFSDSDKKTAENFGIDYMDVSEFVNVYGKGI